MTKNLLLVTAACLALAGCQSGQKTMPVAEPMTFEGTAEEAKPEAPIVPSDPSVQVFPLDGPVQNPLMVEKYHGVLENTTAGGYTVFDESVTVYPLPGSEIPTVAQAQALQNSGGQSALIGERMDLTQGSSLPPVPTINVAEADPYAKPPVPGAVRKPLSLTAVEPVGLQPPSAETIPAPKSPFAPEGPRPPVIASDDMPNAPLESLGAPQPPMQQLTPPVGGAMTPGRKSGPVLTGY